MSYEGHLAGEILQKLGYGKSNLELTGLRITGANSMSGKHRNSMIALWLVAAFFLTSVGAQEPHKSKPAPLMIQEQGSFASV
jgi:hypothetical protein